MLRQKKCGYEEEELNFLAKTICMLPRNTSTLKGMQFGRTSKSHTHRGTREEGRWNPSLGFLPYYNISKIYYLTDSHQTCVKIWKCDMRTATENGRCSWKTVLVNYSRQTSLGCVCVWGGGASPHLVRPRVKFCSFHTMFWYGVLLW